LRYAAHKVRRLRKDCLRIALKYGDIARGVPDPAQMSRGVISELVNQASRKSLHCARWRPVRSNTYTSEPPSIRNHVVSAHNRRESEHGGPPPSLPQTRSFFGLFNTSAIPTDREILSWKTSTSALDYDEPPDADVHRQGCLTSNIVTISVVSPTVESRKGARPGPTGSRWFPFPAHQTGRAG